jgi:hypothetical protein
MEAVDMAAVNTEHNMMEANNKVVQSVIDLLIIQIDLSLAESYSRITDRQFGLFPTTDSCLERAGYFVRSCEDTLIQRQRDAREGRSSNDVQRRICWYDSTHKLDPNLF